MAISVRKWDQIVEDIEDRTCFWVYPFESHTIECNKDEYDTAEDAEKALREFLDDYLNNYKVEYAPDDGDEDTYTFYID